MKQVRGVSLKHTVVATIVLKFKLETKVIKIKDEDINVEEKIAENGAQMNISK